MNQIIKIFLASSSELKQDRQDFEIFISRKNDMLIKRGKYLKLVVWENFLDAMSLSRLQDEYNREIENCDIFIMLYFKKVGKYTHEEFLTAWNAFQKNGRPLIFTYFKNANITTGELSEEVLSLINFQKQLKEKGHFYTSYSSESELQLHFSNQLDKIFDKDKNTPRIKIDDKKVSQNLTEEITKKVLKEEINQEKYTHWNLKEKFQFIDALIECDQLNSLSGIDAVKNELPPNIKNKIRYDNAVRLYMKNIIDTCVKYPNGLKIFMEQLSVYEDDSIAFKKVESLIT